MSLGKNVSGVVGVRLSLILVMGDRTAEKMGMSATNLL